MQRTLLGLLLLGALANAAADENGSGMYLPYGVINCGTVVEANRSGGAQKVALVTWVSGYFTALNASMPDTYDILGDVDMQSVHLWIVNWCSSNPLNSLPRAMNVLAAELYPKRHRTAKESKKN